MSQPDRQPTITRAERIALVVVFIVAAGISILVVGRLGSPEGDIVGPPEARPTIEPSVERPVPLADALELAFGWAREWNAEAWPILVSAQFEFPMDSNQANPEASQGMFIFTFAAPKDGDEWPRLTLAVSRQSGTIYHEDEIESEVEPPASIESILTGLPITAEQAFRVADEIVGQDYREGCAPSRREVQVVLDTTEPDEPTWVVIYFDQRERSVNDIVVRIDANTGATTTEERDDTAC